MSDKPRFPRAAALEVTRELLARLAHTTERMLVAGSLRRRKSDVGDIELVFIPKVVQRPDPFDMFDALIPCDIASFAIEEMIQDGTLEPRPKCNETLTWGDQIKLARHRGSGIPVDFFISDTARFPNLTVCRTGPSEVNIEICNRAISLGWKWNPYGEGFSRPSRIIATPPLPPEVRTMHTEEEVFRFVGLPLLPPEQRTLKNLRAAARDA